MKKMLTATVVLVTILAAGCSEENGTPGQQNGAQRQSDAPETAQGSNQKPKTVIVNEGMSNEEEDELNKRLAELEEQVNGQPAEQTQQETGSAEDSALAAAQDYYAAAAAGNYAYTYSELSSSARSQFTEEEWVADNTALGSDQGTYNIESASAVDASTVDVFLTITAADGSNSERATQFVLENSIWKHELTQEEYALFAGARASDSSTSGSASTPASTSANTNTKLVKIVISSDKPADVSINDDSLNWFVTEEITGTKTYERDIGKNSGISVSATTDAYNAQTSIQVYENGSLVAEDSDSTGFAMVNY